MPRPFEDLLMGHECIHTSRLGWGRLGNGTLLRVAESEGFEAMVTVDRNLPYQQNLPDRSIALVIIESRSNSIHP